MKKNTIIYLLIVLLLIFISIFKINSNYKQKEAYQDEISIYEEKNTQPIIHKYPEIERKYGIERNPIPHDTIFVESSELYEGDQEVIVEGADGFIETICLKKYFNGKLIDKTHYSEYSITEPIDEVIKIGTKPILIISDEELDYYDSFIMTATAYDLSYESTGKRPGDDGYGITYSGTQAGPGTVAVDPDVIPLGTKLYIQSLDESLDYGFATAEDIGSAIQGNRIDVFINDHSEAINFGKKDVKVYILDN